MSLEARLPGAISQADADGPLPRREAPRPACSPYIPAGPAPPLQLAPDWAGVSEPLIGQES